MLRPVLSFSLIVLPLSCNCQAHANSHQPDSATPSTQVEGLGGTQANGVAKNTPMAFDIVSIRQTKPGQRSGGYGMMRDGVLMRNISLRRLVMFAFRVRSDRYLSGLPGWADSVRFDITAKVDEDKASMLRALPPPQAREARLLMLQKMLADRFHFRSHEVSSEVPAYALVVDKGRTKLKEAGADVAGTAGKPETSDSARDGEISLHDVPMALLARQLSDYVNREVVDQTGLTGTWDISLKWTPQASLDQPDNTQAQPANTEADPGPIFTAIREQLGLRLVPTHPTTVNTMVVDHVEMPTEN